MLLSRQTLSAIKPVTRLGIPSPDILLLPEKILQFGTGVLLRGLPGYFVDKANKQGIFNGRMVVVKSTSQGGTASFDAQDNLYTQCIRGIDNGRIVEEAVINASISRVLTAATQWPEVLACAANPQLQIIISNTTEVGLVWQHNDDVHALPPASFPGKLLAFLLQRYTVFNGSRAAGMVIIPTELVPDNGALLKEIVLNLARENRLAPAFIDWLQYCQRLLQFTGRPHRSRNIARRRKSSHRKPAGVQRQPDDHV